MFLVGFQHEVCGGGNDSIQCGKLIRDESGHLSQCISLHNRQQVIRPGHEITCPHFGVLGNA